MIIIDTCWGDFFYKQRLKQLVYPEAVVCNKEKRAVRTFKVNGLFSEIALLSRVLFENKKGNTLKNYTPFFKLISSMTNYDVITREISNDKTVYLE